MRRAILAVILLLLIGAVVATVTILAKESQTAALTAARVQHKILAELTTANVELGLKTDEVLSIRSFLRNLSSEPSYAGGLLLDPDGDPILAVPSSFVISDDLLRTALAEGKARSGQIAYSVSPLKDDEGDLIGQFLIALSEEQIHKDARAALVFTAKLGAALMLPVAILIAWLLSWLERKLQRGERKLRETSTELTLMLDNLGQGVLTFNKEGLIGEVYSRQARSLLGGEDLKCAHLADLLNSTRTEREELDLWIGLVHQPRFLSQWSRCEKLNPFRERTVVKDDQPLILDLEYRPVVVEGELQRVMLLATDVTEARSTALMLEQERERRDIDVRELQSILTTEPILLDAMLEVAAETVARTATAQSGDSIADPDGSLHRALHTLKGDAGTLNLHDLAAAAGALEDVLDEMDSDEQGSVEQWQVCTPKLDSAVEHIIDLRQEYDSGADGSLRVDRGDFDTLTKLLESGSIEGQAAGRRLAALDSVALERCCTHYPQLIQIQADRLQQTPPSFVVKCGETRIPRHLVSVVDVCLVHLVRNALAHGIESAATREAVGKSIAGLIEISAEIDNDTLILTVTDDGAGVDGARLVDKALANGTLTPDQAAALSENEKVNLMFHAGLSSRDQADELSGRGIGMDAVQDAVIGCNGCIDVTSKLGHGLAVRIQLPLSKATLVEAKH